MYGLCAVVEGFSSKEKHYKWIADLEVRSDNAYCPFADLRSAALGEWISQQKLASC
jgi:hypothetical protein